MAFASRELPHAKVSVRPLHHDDTPALQTACWPALSDKLARERVVRALALTRRGRAWPLVGLYAGVVVGFVQLVRWRDGVEIGDLVVGPRWRTRGVGTAIITRLVDLARERGFARLEVGVAQANTRAQALYRRLGFTRCEGHLLLDLGQRPEPVIYLSRALHASG